MRWQQNMENYPGGNKTWYFFMKKCPDFKSWHPTGFRKRELLPPKFLPADPLGCWPVMRKGLAPTYGCYGEFLEPTGNETSLFMSFPSFPPPKKIELNSTATRKWCKWHMFSSIESIVIRSHITFNIFQQSPGLWRAIDVLSKHKPEHKKSFAAYKISTLQLSKQPDQKDVQNHTQRPKISTSAGAKLQWTKEVTGFNHLASFSWNFLE